MLPEFLVWYTCSVGNGCQDTIKAYYEINTDIKNSVEKVEKTIQKIPGSKFIGPIIVTFMAKQDIVIPMSNHLYFETTTELNFNRIRWTYEF